MRCFAAIEINDQSRAALSRAVGTLQHYTGEHKWVKPQNMHLTLRFIGEIKEKTLPGICDALKLACRDASPFSMHIKGLGSFPETGRPKILFARVSESSGILAGLAESADALLVADAGLQREKRVFRPHITICRVRKKGHCPDAESLAAKLQSTDFGIVDVNEVVLMLSETVNKAPVYTTMERFNL